MRSEEIDRIGVLKLVLRTKLRERLDRFDPDLPDCCPEALKAKAR